MLKMQQCALHEKANVTQINVYFITYVVILLYFFSHCCSVLYHVSLITFIITLWLTNVTDTGKCLLESCTDLDKLWLIFLLRFLERNSKDRIKLNSNNSKHDLNTLLLMTGRKALWQTVYQSTLKICIINKNTGVARLHM